MFGQSFTVFPSNLASYSWLDGSNVQIVAGAGGQKMWFVKNMHINLYNLKRLTSDMHKEVQTVNLVTTKQSAETAVHMWNSFD